jgi:cytochrome c-type biogenesis protein CcmE
VTDTTTTVTEPSEPNESGAPPSAPRRRIKARYIVAAVVCLGAVVWMITSLTANIDYWKPVVQALRDRPHDLHKHLRIGGIVVPNSLHGAGFDLSDGKATMHVVLDASEASAPPKACTPLIVGGRWRGSTLLADELTRRHGSDYSAQAHSLADGTPVSSCRSQLGS